MSEMIIHCAYNEIVAIEDLKANPKNPNKHPKEQIKLLAKIMKHQGWRQPVVVSRRSGLVNTGHGRIEAAKLNGWISVPVNYQGFDSDEDEYANMVADNASRELSNTDLALVNLELPNLGPDFDPQLLGFIDFKIDPSELEQEEPKKLKMIECPYCGESFEKGQAKRGDIDG